MVGSGWRKAGLALLLGLLLANGAAEARGRERTGRASDRTSLIQLIAGEARSLPSSSAMQLGDLRLPPPGYLDYCLRYRGIDQGCR